MKIAIVGAFFFPQLDGVEKVMLGHARQLARRGHEVHVVTSRLRCPVGSFPDVPDREEMDGFTIHRLHVPVPNAHWRFIYCANGGVVIQGLVRTLARISPDIVHAHRIMAPAWAFGAAWYALTRRRRFFYTPHYHPREAWETAFKLSLVWALNTLPLRVAHRVLLLTQVDLAPFQAEFPAVRAARLEVLPNGADPPAPHARPPRPEGEVVFLFVGRVDDTRKGFDLLREAWRRLRRPGWRLDVVGRVAEDTAASLRAEFGADIRLLGFVDEAALDAAYAAADIFVMPTRYEAFGMPYIEAMRYGLPVIGTDIGGVPEVVPPGTGLLTPLEDVDALTDAMRRLGEDAAERQRIGEAGRAWAARFRWEDVVARLEAIYRSEAIGWRGVLTGRRAPA